LKKSDIWITVAASLGVGAATFYTMSKSTKPLNKAVESVTPILSNMAGDHSEQSNQNKSTTETMGPFGMS